MSMPSPRRVSLQEYLAFEEQSRAKHEYRDGQVYPLGDPYAALDPSVVIGRRAFPPLVSAGATDTHITIVQNLVVAVRPHLGSGPCRLYSTDMRVQPEVGDYLYPDLILTCDPDDHRDALVKRRPTLIIEVLSPSTEGYDRGEKFDAYATVSSLREYVLVSTRDQRVEVWTRHDGHWERTTYLPPVQIPLSSIDLSVSFSSVYDGVQWGPRRLQEERNPYQT